MVAIPVINLRLLEKMLLEKLQIILSQVTEKFAPREEKDARLQTY